MAIDGNLKNLVWKDLEMGSVNFSMELTVLLIVPETQRLMKMFNLDLDLMLNKHLGLLRKVTKSHQARLMELMVLQTLVVLFTVEKSQLNLMVHQTLLLQLIDL